MGDNTEAAPTARPPNNLAEIKRSDEPAKAVRAQETAKKSATMIRTLFLPYLSVRMPDPKDPAIAPTSRELTPHPSSSSFHPKYGWINGTAPEMIAMSKPNIKPPIVAIRHIKYKYPGLFFIIFIYYV
jgi:hypothetical protein